MCVCPCNRNTPTSGCRGDFCSKNVFLILACDHTILRKKGDFCLGRFFLRLLKHTDLDQPKMDNGGVSGGRYVAVAVGCWLLALQWHSNSTSRALQRHFNGASKELQQHFNDRQKNCHNKEFLFVFLCGQFGYCFDILLYYYIVTKCG